MNLRKRKDLRLKGYDYSRNGAYFITICTKDRRNLLAEIIVGDAAHGVPKIRLTPIGETVNEYILNIDNTYENAYVDKYIIMPNHLHLIIVLETGRDAVGGVPYAISVPKIVNSLKTLTSKKYGKTLWQRSYHDRIIRNEEEYLGIWQYIGTNPQTWEKDCNYVL